MDVILNLLNPQPCTKVGIQKIVKFDNLCILDIDIRLKLLVKVRGHRRGHKPLHFILRQKTLGTWVLDFVSSPYITSVIDLLLKACFIKHRGKVLVVFMITII